MNNTLSGKRSLLIAATSYWLGCEKCTLLRMCTIFNKMDDLIRMMIIHAVYPISIVLVIFIMCRRRREPCTSTNLLLRYKYYWYIICLTRVCLKELDRERERDVVAGITLKGYFDVIRYIYVPTYIITYKYFLFFLHCTHRIYLAVSEHVSACA